VEIAMKTPPIVSAQEWTAAHAELLVREKELTRAGDALAAMRRRMPWLAVDTPYEFDGPDGKVDLLGLFDGRRQLIVYRAFFGPDIHGWPEHGCRGCSMVADHIGNLAHLNARDTTLVLTSPAPQSQIRPYRERMGWSVPWFTASTEFTEDCGAGRGFGISVFLRAGDRVCRTYFTTGRGSDLLNTTLRWLDLTPLGRQEAWQDAARGDSAASSWWRLHDEYM
jgi:predicted dithiol-disulfide oxidoreductase (DUF899 family)